jgi:hypothetical protein
MLLRAAAEQLNTMGKRGALRHPPKMTDEELMEWREYMATMRRMKWLARLFLKLVGAVTATAAMVTALKPYLPSFGKGG